MEIDTSNGVPQFATAEFPATSPNLVCGGCQQPIVGPYYRVNRTDVCSSCTQKLRDQTPRDSHAAFVRAISFGLLGAIAGFALYVTVALATGLVIGFASLAVGLIVGKAMLFGSKGVGGRRYQIAAVTLTYIAVSMSAVPIAISQLKQHRAAQQTSAIAGGASPQRIDLGKAIGTLTLLGVASPFLDLQDPVHGLIGLVILFVGVRIAWRFTAARVLPVTGPFSPSTAPATSI